MSKVLASILWSIGASVIHARCIHLFIGWLFHFIAIIFKNDTFAQRRTIGCILLIIHILQLQAPLILICVLRVIHISFDIQILLDLSFIPALYAKKNYSDEEYASSSAKYEKYCVIAFIDLCLGTIAIDLKILWSLFNCFHLHNFVSLDRLSFTRGVILLFCLFSWLWLDLSLEPVIETKLRLLVLVGVGHDQETLVDANGEGLSHGGLLVAGD